MKAILRVIFVAFLLIGLVGCFDMLEEKQRKDFHYFQSQYSRVDKEFDKVDYNIVRLLNSFYNKTTSNQSLIRWIDEYAEDVKELQVKFSKISLGSSNNFNEKQKYELTQGINDYIVGMNTYLESLELYKLLAENNSIRNQEVANKKYEEAIDQLVNALFRLREVGIGVGAIIHY